MKAVRFHKHGGIEELKYEDVDEPVAGPGEIVVRVKACAINHLDLWERVGLPGVRIPLPHISGSDVSGIVESIGPGVENIRPGSATLLYPGLSCMHCPACFEGHDNLCRRYTILGLLTDGGYAEFVKVPAVNALPFPEGLSFTGAAALPLVFLTAWHMLVTRCAIKAGEDVLILGAGSGVGSAAVQIAKFFRARVIATAGSAAKLEKARELGADFVIDHSRRSIRDEVWRFTHHRGVDVVFEHIGSATWQDSFASLAYHGRLVTCGATTGHDASIDIRQLFAKQISIFGSYMGPRHELLEVLRLVQKGYLRPVVSAVLPLEEAGRAQQMVENREHFGKIVLAVA
ncbi:MAG: zinc-binding dehydrogenase [Acidobacteria bacterium]|nr:zinc-binding dehydrogenase [Acidobacteriota bacterium]